MCFTQPIDESIPSARDHQQPPYRKRFLSDISDSNVAMSDHNAMSDSTVDSHTIKASTSRNFYIAMIMLLIKPLV